MFTTNLVSVAIAAAAAWIFGAAYYTALSKPWMAANGLTMEECKSMHAGKSALGRAAPFILCFIAEIVMAWVLYGILVHLNMFTLRGGVISGAFCWFGFVLTTIAVTNAFVARRPMLTIIDSGHWLGVLLIIGGIVGWMGR